jgi:hypothetical protein
MATVGSHARVETNPGFLPAMTTDSKTIAIALLYRSLCIDCLAIKSGLSIERTKAAIVVLQVNLRLSRVQGECPACFERRDVLSLP